ncbi:M48 family metalloprotease [Flavobacterium ardleyense]|uniref:M48 family metalloprotease n=1 Tax=Flavobacterium ardleyense TaxID=2038737 RepID=UPI00298CED3C|nr:M48 family metalloprotease [Flavobacterium ardleyense]
MNLNIMMAPTRFFLALAAVFILTDLQAQHAVSIDTLNLQYRKSLIIDYGLRAAKVESEFASLTDRSVRNQTLKVYKSRKKDVEEQINKGLFFGDNSYTTFLKSQLDVIEKANPNWKEINQVTILVAAAENPNASASAEGYVVFNLPMFLRARNQFTIAYVLCHEIAHRLLNHSYTSVVASAELNTSSDIKAKTSSIKKNKYNKGKMASELFRQIVYEDRKTSRSVEFQADSLGYVLFAKAFPEAKSEAVNSLLWLSDIDKDKDSISILHYQKVFSTPNQPFNMKWLEKDEISDYTYDKTPKFWTIDSLKTHPDCELRAERMTELFKVEENIPRPANAGFAELKKSAPFDYIYSLHYLKSYGLSLYHCLLQLQTNPEDKWLRQMTGQNLEKLQELQNLYRLNEALETPDPQYSTSYNTFLHLIREMRKSELNEIITYYKSI